MNGLPTTPAETAKLAADVKEGEAPFVSGVGDEIVRALRARYPQLRSASLMAGDCSLIIRVDCNFSGRARRVIVAHHIEIPGAMLQENVQVDVRPMPPKL